MAEEEAAARLVAQAGRTWDALPTDGTLDADIDAEAVRAFVRRAAGREHPRLPRGMRESAPIDVVLGNLDLLAEDGRPTHAAVLLFGRRPQRLVRAAVIRMAYFRTNNDFTAYPDCGGTVFEQIDVALRQIESANPPSLAFGASLTPDDAAATGLGGMSRRERVSYPPLALREAVTNAVVHRDYLRAGVNDRLILPTHRSFQTPHPVIAHVSG